MPVRCRVTTPRSRPAALATIDLAADSPSELETLLGRVCGSAVDPGCIGLRRFAGVDEGLLVRTTPTHAMLMPHGGPAVLDQLVDALVASGCDPSGIARPRELFPEAASDLEAATLAALARAASPLAVEPLLHQPDRWAGEPWRAPGPRDLRLRRLIDPPLVVVVGPPNVGKSSLLNALAGREAAIVDDAPGTTRDHIGAMLDLGGLVVRWVDTPGRRSAEGVEAQAIEASKLLDRGADLLVAVGDFRSEDPRALAEAEPGLTLAARADLGRPGWGFDGAVSAKTGEGLGELVAMVRDTLVPPADLDDPSPWVFCDDLDTGPR